MLQGALPMMERTHSIELPNPCSAEGITATDALDSINGRRKSGGALDDNQGGEEE